MAERLAGGNVALALLGNTLATGAILIVLVLALGSDLGRSLQSSREYGLRSAARTNARLCLWYTAAQMVGAVVGVLVAHAMFEQPVDSIVDHAFARDRANGWLNRSRRSASSARSCAWLSRDPQASRTP